MRGSENMDCRHGYEHYTSSFVQDNENGSVGMELYRTISGNKSKVAQVLYWDAAGQFYLQTFDAEIPIEIAEALIAETKAAVNLR